MDVKQAKIKAKYLRQQDEALRMRKANRWLGFSLATLAGSIYIYSMYTIKQEAILTEIDDKIGKS